MDRPEHLDWFYNDHQPLPGEPIELDLHAGGGGGTASSEVPARGRPKGAARLLLR